MNKLLTIVGMGPGVSLAVANRFSAEGYAVAMVARSQEKVDTYASELRQKGRQALGFAGNAGNEDSLRQVFSDIHAKLGATDVLVYNAFARRQGGTTALTAEQLVEDFRVNVVGALVSVQQVVEAMRKAGRGTILLTGGGLALDPVPQLFSSFGGFASLAIGKAGMRSLTFSLAKDLEPAGIHVATVTICGIVQDGTYFAPSTIAEVFYRLHLQPAEQWEREIIYRRVS